MADDAFDLFVIGGGSGGMRAARMAGQRGVRVGIAEAGALGGTCVNVGCIPKKLYSYAAEYPTAFEESQGFGWRTSGTPRLDWALLKRNRATEITRLNEIYADLLANAGVQLLRGRATLEDAHTVAVNGERLRAERVLLATGGWPTVPEIAGRELVITSNEIFDLDPFADERDGPSVRARCAKHLAVRHVDGGTVPFVRERWWRGGLAIHAVAGTDEQLRPRRERRMGQSRRPRIGHR